MESPDHFFYGYIDHRIDAPPLSRWFFLSYLLPIVVIIGAVFLFSENLSDKMGSTIGVVLASYTPLIIILLRRINATKQRRVVYTRDQSFEFGEKFITNKEFPFPVELDLHSYRPNASSNGTLFIFLQNPTTSIPEDFKENMTKRIWVSPDCPPEHIPKLAVYLYAKLLEHQEPTVSSF